MNDPHDLRSPYPFRRRVLCPIDPYSIEDALTCMSRHFRLGMWNSDVMAYAKVVRLCPNGVLSADSWCLRWSHQPDGHTSIVIEDPYYPFGVCPDAQEIRQSYAPIP